MREIECACGRQGVVKELFAVCVYVYLRARLLGRVTCMRVCVWERETDKCASEREGVVQVFLNAFMSISALAH